jgi:hypothetical protein
MPTIDEHGAIVSDDGEEYSDGDEYVTDEDAEYIEEEDGEIEDCEWRMPMACHCTLPLLNKIKRSTGACRCSMQWTRTRRRKTRMPRRSQASRSREVRNGSSHCNSYACMLRPEAHVIGVRPALPMQKKDSVILR